MREKLNIFTNLTLLLLGVFCQTEMLRETLAFHVESVFYFWLTLLCIGLWYTAHGNRFNGIGILISLFVLFLAYHLEKPDILSLLSDFFDRIAHLVSERFLLNTDSYPYSGETVGYSFLFLSFAFVESAYLAIALSSRGARTDLALLGTLPFSVFCVAVSEHPPMLPLLGILLFWFLTAIGGSYFRKDSGSSIGVLTALLPLAALLAALLLIVNPQNYEYKPPQLRFDEQLSAIGKAFRQLAEKIPHEELEFPLPAHYAPRETRQEDPSPAQQRELFSAQEVSPSFSPREVTENILWQDTDGKMDLTVEPDPTLLDKVFLRVRTTENGPLYLRALSFGDYIGTGWLPAEERAPVSSLSFTAQALAALGAVEKQLSLRLLLPAPYRFTPYFCEDSGSSDSFLPSTDQLSYTATYRLAGQLLESASLPQRLSGEELSYREYALEYYTHLPDATRSALLALLEEKHLLSSETPVSDIAAFVQQTGQYDTEVETYPGDDYALCFLTEMQRGYCVHFATAAAALYRAAGIPARVTEGFLVHSIAGRMMDVKGSDAHAWVEIYQDGLGWIPVEVTGQSGLKADPDGEEPAEIQKVEAETTFSPSPSGENPDIMSASQDIKAPEPEEHAASAAATPSPSPSPSLQLPVGIISDPFSSAESESSRLSLLWLLLLPVLIILMLPFYCYHQRCKRVPDAHSTVIAVYNTCLSLSIFDISLSPDIKKYAEKAAFSRNSVTDQEAESCKAELCAMLSRLKMELKLFRRLSLNLSLFRSRWHYPWLNI